MSHDLNTINVTLLDKTNKNPKIFHEIEEYRKAEQIECSKEAMGSQAKL